MDTTKTLLQQIREKEQDVNKTIEAVRQESEAEMAAARAEAEKIRHESDLRGTRAAEELTQKEKEKTEAEVGMLKKNAAAEKERIVKNGEKNKNAASETVVRQVTMR